MFLPRCALGAFIIGLWLTELLTAQEPSALRKPIWVRGQVVDELGQPVEGVRIALLDVRKTKNSEVCSLATRRGAVTNEQGYFSLRGMAAPMELATLVLNHPEYEHAQPDYSPNQLLQPLELTINMLEGVRAARQIVELPVGDMSNARLNELLSETHYGRGIVRESPHPDRLPSALTGEVFPFIGRMRPHLLHFIASLASKWRPGDTPFLRRRAIELLALWGDPRDEELRQSWWMRVGPQPADLKRAADGPRRELRPDIPAAKTLHGIYAAWLKTMGNDPPRFMLLDSGQLGRKMIFWQSGLRFWKTVFIREGTEWKVLCSVSTPGYPICVR